MKILFISQRFVLPMDAGGKIRTGKILEKLSQQHEITMISNVESPRDDAYLDQVGSLCSRFVAVPWKEVRRGSFLFFVRLFFQMFSLHPVSALNTDSRSMREAVEREVREHEYDVVLCDFVQSALLLRNVSHPHMVLWQHNVESEIARRHVEQASNPLSRLFWWLQWRKMFHYERRECRRFDTVIAVSEHDAAEFGRLYGVDQTVAIPTGVDIDYYSQAEAVKGPPYSLAFCGSMDWLPNEDGMLFFINEALPLIDASLPDVEIVIIGRRPSKQLQAIAAENPRVRLTGWVEDTRPYLNDASAVIVPLRIGGGTRMKIFEAMAMGKAVVSTTIGAEGLPVEHEREILIADSPEELAKACVDLLRDVEFTAAIGQRAHDYVVDNFGWAQVAKVFSRACEPGATEQSVSLDVQPAARH